MLPVTTGWPALPITTFNCIIGQERPALMWMPCQEHPGWPAWLIPQTCTFRSLQWQYELCRRLFSKASWVQLKPIAVMCMSCTQQRTVSRSLARLQMTGVGLSGQPWSWVSSLWGYKRGIWPNASSRQLIPPICDSSLGSATTSRKAFSKEDTPQRIPRGPIPAHPAGCIQGDCCQRVPWQHWPFRSRMHARPDAWPLLLALPGYTGQGAYWTVSSISHL